MIEKENASLKEMTTIKVGGTAKRLLAPESEDELLDVINREHPKYFIGGGSNLLINDREFDLVVDLKGFNKEIKDLGEGCFLVGASVRLQELINTIYRKGYVGIEFLYSVPGLVGGAVVMNAGRGAGHNMNISHFIVAVHAIENGRKTVYSRTDCMFSHRNSIFKNSDIIVTSVLFMFPKVDMNEAEKAKKARIKFSKDKQDNSKPNFGSVFMTFSPGVMELEKLLKAGNSKAGFSGKTRNWMLNKDDAGFDDVVKAIKKAEKMHRMLFQRCKREVIIWE